MRKAQKQQAEDFIKVLGEAHDEIRKEIEKKNISAAMWIQEDSVPTVCAYGAWDRAQAFGASRRLDQALTQYNIPHEYIVFEHSGHGLQNDNARYAEYMDKVSEYLDTYMPIG